MQLAISTDPTSVDNHLAAAHQMDVMRAFQRLLKGPEIEVDSSPPSGVNVAPRIAKLNAKDHSVGDVDVAEKLAHEAQDSVVSNREDAVRAQVTSNIQVGHLARILQA